MFSWVEARIWFVNLPCPRHEHTGLVVRGIVWCWKASVCSVEQRNRCWLLTGCWTNHSEKYESQLGWVFLTECKNNKCSTPPNKRVVNRSWGDTYIYAMQHSNGLVDPKFEDSKVLADEKANVWFKLQTNIFDGQINCVEASTNILLWPNPSNPD